MTDPLTGPLFDAYAFAVRLKAAVQRVGGMREAERLSGIPVTTFSRVCAVWPALSHENYLRLEQWMAGLEQEQAA